MASNQVFKTDLTDLFGINHPVMLAGMNVAAGPKLAAAVTNAGGIGVIGGVGAKPDRLQEQIDELKGYLNDKNAPFGVDLLLPQVGGNARKTNYDYTKGQLDELVDVIIKSKAALFVCAIGVPPKKVVDRLHEAKIPVMNMIGHPKHVQKALDCGVDLICAQAGEGGGHTGDIPFSILIPAVVDLCKDAKSPLTGKPVNVVAAGAVADGRSLAAALSYGAAGVWVGTRFVASEEAGAPKMHKDWTVKAGYDDVTRTLIYTGRPLRVFKTPYVMDWEENRQQEIKSLTSRGIIPAEHDVAEKPEIGAKARTFLTGSVAARITDVKPAKDIVDELVHGAAAALQQASKLVVAKSKL
ncbi:2-nitropropane dioxygenase [Auriculariales sp. MPI-PUGE-AT-0066]|nr:2-nitropropane dioxygenase [Auriculariales sp. MPI-PUGE-AT-0066]